MRQTSFVVSTALLLIVLCNACKGQDPRLAVFEKFNRATTYDQARPLVSGLLATQLDAAHSRQPDQVPKVLESLHLKAYQARIVDIDDTASFLVLENVQSDTVKQSRQTYVVSRIEHDQWTLANRIQAESVVPALWKTQYAPAAFNQSSQCSLTANPAPGNVAPLKFQSALAYRMKDRIEITLLPFPLSQGDLDFLRMSQGQVLKDPAAAQASSFRNKYARCRIILSLNTSGRIQSLNIGYDDPSLGSSIFQGPGWSTLPATGAQTGPQTGLPPEFRNLQISEDRIRVDTEGDLVSGSNRVRWSAKLDLPLWTQVF